MNKVPTLRALSRTQFTIAQACTAAAFVVEVMAVVVGIVGSVVPDKAAMATLVLAVLALLGIWVRGFGSRFASSAHDILRRLDLQDSLGRPIHPSVVADLIDDVPGVVQRMAAKRELPPYFSSTENPGPRRLLENLRESSWWTKRLANDMAIATTRFTYVLIAVGLLTLLAGVNGLLGSGSDTGLSTWVSAVILFAIAHGPHRAAHEYAQLRDSAASVQQSAELYLQKPEPLESEALQVAADYHLARQGAPVIPTLWYQRRRAHLNQLWDDVRLEESVSLAGE